MMNLKLEIKSLKKENEELNTKLGMDSSNSSFPRSSDKFKKKVVNLLEGKQDIKVVLLKKLKILIS